MSLSRSRRAGDSPNGKSTGSGAKHSTLPTEMRSNRGSRLARSTAVRGAGDERDRLACLPMGKIRHSVNNLASAA
jgi:hypothetical protein